MPKSTKKRLGMIEWRSLKVLLPTIYVGGLIIGFILTLLFAAFPQLVVCSSLLGEEFCAPTGLVLFLVLSLPGYLIMGNVASLAPQLSMTVTLFFTVGLSGLIYFFLGLAVDSVVRRKLTTRLATIYIIIASIIILLFALLFLYR
jgi:uncharacterized membrane protein